MAERPENTYRVLTSGACLAKEEKPTRIPAVCPREAPVCRSQSAARPL